ncbi:MAG TPA: S41 family peptidase [Fimbriimonadaceae bacterium]|nr:S41 family peptidase [Fimbriimonadaceae bacterium]
MSSLRSWSLLALGVVLVTTVAAQPIRRAKHPAVSPDGRTMIFSWQGDLWRVPTGGGEAERLTVHAGDDVFPKWMPDGSRIVFASDRHGSYDLFSMRPDGSDLRRLTFDTALEYPTGISADGKTIFGYTNAWGNLDAFKVSANGGDTVRLTLHPLEVEYHPVPTPDGKGVVYVRGGSPGSWRNPYDKGANTGEIWVADGTVPLSNHRQLTKNENMDLWPMVAPDGSITFVSNRGGWPNLWRMNSDGGNPKLLTFHTDGTLRMPTMSADGSTVAYEFESDLFTLDTKTGMNKKVAIEVPSDQRLNPNILVNVTSGVSDYAIAPDGKRAVLVVRGELFLIPERGGTTRRLTESPALDTAPIWLDGKTILFVSGRNGKRELFTVDVDGNEKPFASDPLDLTNPELSPDGKMIAVHRGLNEIASIPVGGGALTTVAKGVFPGAVRGGPAFSWSPDSKWIVFERGGERSSTAILKEVAGPKEIAVARAARGFDSVPQFLPNGKAIYFTATEFTESDLFVVDLVPVDVTFTEDDLDKIDAPRKEAGVKSIEVQVYEPGLMDRMRRLTTDGVLGSPLASPDSRAIWANVAGQLSAISVSTGTATPVAGVAPGFASGLKLGPNGQKLYFVSTGRLSALTLQTGTVAPVAFNAQFTVNLKEEEKALFEEIWWSMDRMYYDENINQKNWKQIREKFAKIVPYAFDRADFYAMMAEMMEEIDSSHLGTVAPPSAPVDGADATAMLGVEWNWPALNSRGVYLVDKVNEGTPAAHPQSLLKKDDRILAVDGEEVTTGKSISAMLNRKSGRKVRLTVERNGRKIDVEIKPIDSAARGAINYENYVKWQRAQVDKLSNGQLAYLHIQGMNDPSFDRFLREMRTLAEGKKGVLIDVRFNGGGSTSHKVLGILVKQPWLYRNQRGDWEKLISENLWRGDSLELPTALLINQYSFSNAEILAEGFRRLKRGPIIGERTAGGVIGTSQLSLWDGGQIRVPAAGAFTVDGENLEGNGRRPDFNVPFDPNAWLGGRDTQLEKAVEELMKTIEPKATPSAKKPG